MSTAMPTAAGDRPASESGRSRQSWYKAYVKDTVRVASAQKVAESMDVADDEVFDEPSTDLNNNSAADADYYKVMGRRPPSQSEDAGKVEKVVEVPDSASSANQGTVIGLPVNYGAQTYHGVGVMYEEYKPPKKYVKPEEKRRSSSQTTYIVGCAPDKCKICEKKIYEMEKVLADHVCYHKQCFRCVTCNQLLSLRNYLLIDGQLSCPSHRDVVQSRPRIGSSVDDIARNESPEKKATPAIARAMSMPSCSYQNLNGLSTKTSEKPLLVKVDESGEEFDELAAINEAFRKFKTMEAETSTVKQEMKSAGNKQTQEKSENKANALLIHEKLDDDIVDAGLENTERVENTIAAFDKAQNSQPLAASKFPTNDYRSQEMRETPVVITTNGNPSVQDKPTCDIPVTSAFTPTQDHDNDYIPISEAMEKFKTLEKQQESELVAGSARKEVRKMTPPREEPRYFLENGGFDFVPEPKVNDLVVARNTVTLTQTAAEEDKKNVLQNKASFKNTFVQIIPSQNGTVSTTTVSEPSTTTKPFAEAPPVDARDGVKVPKTPATNYPPVKFTQNLLPMWKLWEQQALLISEDASKKRTSSPALRSQQRVDEQKEQSFQLVSSQPIGSSALAVLPDAVTTELTTDAVDNRVKINDDRTANTNGVVMRRSRESQRIENPRQPQPRPSSSQVLSFTRRPLAKFKEMEARAQADSMSPNAYQRKQTFKWDVKEPAVLQRPILVSGSALDTQYSNDSRGYPSADLETTAGQSTSNGEEYFTVEYMQRILVQFRALEDSSRPPPAPVGHKRSSGGVGRMYGINRQMFAERGIVTNEYAMEAMNCY